jgi:hypothetical protein
MSRILIVILIYHCQKPINLASQEDWKKWKETEENQSYERRGKVKLNNVREIKGSHG